jgi:putative bacteriocin precursor
MKKLGKKRNDVKHTIEAYGCYCHCYVGCFCDCEPEAPESQGLSYQGQGGQIDARRDKISNLVSANN